MVLLKTNFSHTAVPNTLLATVIDSLYFHYLHLTFSRHHCRLFPAFLSVSVILVAALFSLHYWPAYVPATDSALFSPPEKPLDQTKGAIGTIGPLFLALKPAGI
ncbi:hypothetical protein DdX_10498 [Ditylenchus destructor]|uniref:Uncharacterized protein n=1 Tax=Ditylenchus destructor TaxID=166010 RepID=A0AAD4R250_9BILA|nr:hypothetical protein DdX_10498 [Ditylenchus destructor]